VVPARARTPLLDRLVELVEGNPRLVQTEEPMRFARS